MGGFQSSPVSLVLLEGSHGDANVFCWMATFRVGDRKTLIAFG